MIKWIHFYKTGSNQVSTFHLENNTFQENAQEHTYAGVEDVLAKNTVETFNFWDGEPIGKGQS